MGRFSYEEYLNVSTPKDIPDEFEDSAMELCRRVNELRQSYGRPMIASSGYRDPAHNRKIGGSPTSRHLRGTAVDILDPNGDLATFVMTNQDILEKLGLWVENPHYTEGWVHFQTVPPKSGERAFIPY